MTKKDLIKAAEDLNKLLFDEDEKDEGWIFTDTDGPTMKSEIKKAAMFLYAGDELSDEIVGVLQSFTWSGEDFKDMGEDQDPIPSFIRYKIIPDPDTEVEEEKPKKKTRKKKEKPAPEPEPEPEPIVEDVPEEEPEVEVELHDSSNEQPEIEDIPDEPEEKPTEKVSLPEPEMSAYSYAMVIMGPNPTKKLQELTREMANVGYDMFTVGNSVKTAHSIFRKVYRILRENGHIDGAR